MTWHGRLSRAWIAVVLASSGCMARPSALSALPPAAAAGANGSDVARSQKPDARAPHANPTAVCLIGQPVDPPAEASHANPTATICAVVNGEPILDEEVKASCYQQLFAARTAKERQEIMKQALEAIIDREILLQEAISRLEKGGPQGAKFIEKLREAAGEEFDKRWLRPIMKQNHIESRDDFGRFMQDHGMSLEVMRRWWERNFMAMQYLHSRIEPHISRIGHTDIADYYASHSEEFTQPDSVQWQDIFIDATPHASRADARRFAESLIVRVREGEDFAKLSAEFDNGTSGRFRKGDGQGRKHGEIFPPEAEPILFQMHDGDIQIVERQRGFHVIRLVKRDYAGPIPFDEKVQKEIRDKLRNIVFQREMKGIVTELKRKAIIDPPVR
jgi:peptidyl-prolyl cis-trans isomerase SurA